MITEHNKYFECILYFFCVEDYDKLLQILQPIINDPAIFFYNYVQEDIQQRCVNLFERIFIEYARSIDDQYYKAFWNIIHMIPLVAKESNYYFLEYFYKDFIISNVHCMNCIMHYICFLSEVPEADFKDLTKLFEIMVTIHNEVNANNEKDVKDTILFYEECVEVLTTLYPMITINERKNIGKK